MNKEIQAEMRKELIQSKKGSGFLAGFACFLTFFSSSLWFQAFASSSRRTIGRHFW